MPRLPAEWEPLRAVWVAWPHRRSDWPGKLAAVRLAWAEMVRLITRHVPVCVLVDDADREAEARRTLDKAGADMAVLSFHHIPTDRAWLRDTAPIFVEDEGAVKALDFRFNAWARYKDFAKDDAVAASVAEAAGLPAEKVRHKGSPLVLEGGAIDSNGAGVIMTTTACLLQGKRNPGLTAEDYQQILKDHLGIEDICWLAQGIMGDDTSGHVDDVCRFVGPTTVLACTEINPADANHKPLDANLQCLEDYRLPDGAGLEVVPLPMPSPLYYDGCRLPASYANFLIADDLVLVPTFNDLRDRLALNIIAECLPGRKVIGLHAVDLILGLGAVHCLTYGEPLLKNGQ
jgi:agmatine deiminase